jgi:hypothetical protein
VKLLTVRGLSSPGTVRSSCLCSGSHVGEGGGVFVCDHGIQILMGLYMNEDSSLEWEVVFIGFENV